MTQREKLVELIANALAMSEDVADYLLKNGVIAPPCKEGDKVWLVLTEKGNNDWCIFEDIVERFVRCDNYEFCFSLKTFGYIYIDGQTNDLDDGLYDGCAYFTKEEAEKALAEKESD